MSTEAKTPSAEDLRAMIKLAYRQRDKDPRAIDEAVALCREYQKLGTIRDGILIDALRLQAKVHEEKRAKLLIQIEAQPKHAPCHDAFGNYIENNSSSNASKTK